MLAPSQQTVLIVEDHPLTRRFLADNLAAEGYQPIEAGLIAHARERLLASPPTLMLLDLSLPDGDGLAFLDEIRDPVQGLAPELPVLVLSGRCSELERIRGLGRGADDYLVKPFSYPELRARIEALLRRLRRRPGMTRMRVGGLEVDPLSRQVWVEGREVRLSTREFALLRTLAAAPDRVHTREELLREAWGFKAAGVTRTLDTHVHRLRRKLSGGRAEYIINVWGVGYRLLELAPTS